MFDPPKKRGAPPGNTNALKHGFYSRRFPQVELDSLAELPEGLAAEIQMLRLMIQRLMDLADQARDLDQVLHLVNTLGRATAYLDRLVRTQKAIFRKNIAYPPPRDPARPRYTSLMQVAGWEAPGVPYRPGGDAAAAPAPEVPPENVTYEALSRLLEDVEINSIEDILDIINGD